MSTSTTASNASTASTFSVASTATSMSAASAKSTETVKPNGVTKSKQPVLPIKVKRKPQDTTTGIQPTTKASSTGAIPLSKDQPKAKPAATKPNGTLKVAPGTADGSDAAAVQLPKKIITKKKQPAAPTASVIHPEQPKGEPLGSKSVNGLPKSANAPVIKKKAVKPKITSNLPTTTATATDTGEVLPAKPEAEKTEIIPQSSAQPIDPTTPSSKKSKVPKLNGTVKKTILKPRPQPTSTDIAAVSSKPAQPKIAKPAATAEKKSLPKPTSQALAAATTAAKRIVSAPISATPRSVKAPRIKPRSTTPPPAGIQRPQTDGPAARRKSVSFRSPLEAFQIIPARRASTPPPSMSSRRSSIASVAKTTEPAMDPPAKETLPAEPVAKQQSVDEVDADDLVFQDEQDEFDRFPDMPALRPIDEEIATDDGQDALEPLDALTALDAIPEESDEPQPPPTTTDAAFTAPTSAHDDLHTTTATSSVNGTSINGDDVHNDDDNDGDDDDTVFFDADESYVPHYSGSPRKSGTPRLRTPGSAGSRLPKLGKTPNLKDSPKLNLLRLNSPVRKVKKRKSVGEKVKEGVARFEGMKSPAVVREREGVVDEVYGGEVNEVGA